jgi:hypothetical protein
MILGREACNGAWEKLDREAKDETVGIFGGKVWQS